jgi:anti-sigma factor RsiW
MSTSDHPLDELLSAYLDGEASAEERARVEEALATDPAAAARHRRLAAATAALAPTVTAPPDVVDAQIARALAAAVVDLDAARRARRRPTVFAAAAAIAGVFLVGALLAVRGGSEDTELADGTPVETADATGAADAAPAVVLEAESSSAAAMGADGTPDAQEAEPRDTTQAEALVTVEPDAALAEAVLGLLASDDAAPIPRDDGCPDAAATAAGLVGPIETSGPVTVDGVPLVLYVGAERVAVVDETCAVRVVDRPAG